MLYKKFGQETYANAPKYKQYQTEDKKEMLLIDKKYSVIKQGKIFITFINTNNFIVG